MKSEYKLLIDGSWGDGSQIKPVVNPYDGSTVADVHRADAAQVEEAIVAAQKGFEKFRKMAAHERQTILEQASQLIKDRTEELALTIASEAGKPIKDARVEVERAATTFSLAAGESVRIHGEVLPLDINRLAGDRLALVQRFPLGVVSAISPFNFPLNLVAHKVAPALAAGNSVVLKPSSSTPITALMLGEILLDAGLPEGAFHVVPCSPKHAQPLLSHPAVKMVTFTGSPVVGWDMKSRCGRARICLELGGNSGAIVDADADIDHAVTRCVIGGYSYAGQICISLQRLYLHETIADRFLDAFIKGVKALEVGDPLKDETQMGPMIDEAAAVKAESWINQAVEAGGKILCGGKRQGNMLEPTILIDVPPDQPVSCEEVFAPVVVIYRYSDFEAAVNAVDTGEYGLQAGVFTKDISKILMAFNRIEVGGLIVNDIPTYRADNYPYGGVKASGLGREGVRYAVEEMTEMRTLVINNNR
ncbi:aldehyde dehydrogenase [candidate division LCP-89 bacterium B3_LCP]|uniref:Aldehyde dehydrogenase n=1 Tax=candidate division LCP-89 bacterium B3_LCP TaxID=2012998 RepID=A0A532UYN2_UNCL8|nr:MAG: aldehyde dehydrogenase [candidate division LCP-89 bacterium B3_LCP]